MGPSNNIVSPQIHLNVAIEFEMTSPASLLWKVLLRDMFCHIQILRKRFRKYVNSYTFVDDILYCSFRSLSDVLLTVFDLCDIARFIYFIPVIPQVDANGLAADTIFIVFGVTVPRFALS